MPAEFCDDRGALGVIDEVGAYLEAA